MEVGDFVGVFVGVASTNHVEIEEAVVAEVDIGKETAVFVALVLATVKDEMYCLAAEDLFGVVAGLAPEAFDFAARIDGLGCVDADETDFVFDSSSLDFDGVAVDDFAD